MQTINTLNQLSGLLVPCVVFGGFLSPMMPVNASETECYPECSQTEDESRVTLTKSGQKDWQQAYKKYQRQWTKNQQQWRVPQIYRNSQINWSQNRIPQPQPRYDLYLRNLEQNQQRSLQRYERTIKQQQRQLRKLWDN